MGYIIFHVLITFFAVAGFIEFMQFLITLVLKDSKGKSILLIFPESDKIEYELRSYTSKIHRCKNLKPQKIVCVSNNLTEEAKEICRLYSKEYDFIETTDYLHLEDLIKDI